MKVQKERILGSCLGVNIASYFFFYVHVTVHRDKFLTIKPTRCTNFSNLFLEWNSTCFGQFLCPSSGAFHCIHITYTLLCVEWKTPDNGQRNCLKQSFIPKIKLRN